MSGFNTDFTPSGTGHNRGTVPDPGGTAGNTHFLREDATWAIPGGHTPVPPPPAPGPALNQWACNIAGYLTYDVARFAVKYALDGVPTTWLGDVVGGIAAGIFKVVFGVEGAIAVALETAIFNWVSGHIVGLASAAIANLLDDVLWAKIHCIAYSAVLATPTNLASILTAIAGGISLLAGYNAAAISCLNYLFANLGLTDIFGIPVGALAANYDCSTCATTHVGPTQPLLQKSFDLTVKDTVNSDAFVDSVEFDGGVVTGSSPKIIVELNGTLCSVNLEQTGTVAATASGGTTISGLVVGNRYALQSVGGPWSTPGATTTYAWQASNDGGTTWDDVFCGTHPNVAVSPWSVSTPAWALAAERTDANHVRIVFVATTTSIVFRCADTFYPDNSGSLGWQLLDVAFEGSSIVFANNGSAVRTRPELNFVNGGGITWSLTDDPTNDKMDVSASVSGVSSVGATAPITSSGGSTPTIGLTTPLATQYGGTGLDTSGVTDGQLLIGNSTGHVWNRANLTAGAGITISNTSGGISISASGGGGGGTALTQLRVISLTDSTASTVSFTGIPSGYSALRIIWLARSTTASTAWDFLYLRLNNDGSNVYDYELLTVANGVSNGDSFAQAQMEVGLLLQDLLAAGFWSAGEIILPFYASTVAYKNILAQCSADRSAGTATNRGTMTTGLYHSTSAVTEVDLNCGANNFKSGSQFVLYGMA